MIDEREKFAVEILKPWSLLNIDLTKPLVLNEDNNEFIFRAKTLATSIKHFGEYLNIFKPSQVIGENQYYDMMSDLSDSSKHGVLNIAHRQCNLSTLSIIEESQDLKVRFLRNQIVLSHNKYGNDLDFLEISEKAAKFLMDKCGLGAKWDTNILVCNFSFSSDLNVTATNEFQTQISNWRIKCVKINSAGEYEKIQLSAKFNGTITHNFNT